MKKYSFIYTLLLLIFDALFIVIAFAIGDFLKNLYPNWSFSIILSNSRLLIFAVVTTIAIGNTFKLYDLNLFRSEIDEFGSVFGALTISMLFFEFMTIFYRDMIFKRMTILYSWFFAILFISTYRILFIKIIRRLLRKGIGVSNVLLIGTGDEAKSLAKKIQRNRESGLNVIGFVKLEEEPLPKDKSINVLGTLRDLENLIIKFNIDSVICTIPEIPNSLILEIIEKCELNKAQFKFVPKVLDIIESRVSTDEIVGVPLITVKEIKLYGINAFLKRLSDIVYSIIFIILLSPIMLLIAILIKIDSPGPVIFVQRRVGMGGKEFNMYKFRSMRQNAESEIVNLLCKNEANGLIFKIKNDPRVTRVGRFLRKWSLDELPQLFNVLKGDMSFVGPRPPLPSEVEKYNSWHRKRLRVCPGITGLWQVSGRSDISFEEMVKLDIYYIESWSLWQDIKIMLKTIPVVIFAKGAY